MAAFLINNGLGIVGAYDIISNSYMNESVQERYGEQDHLHVRQGNVNV